jgi:adhesin transport system membrane fusion protein
MNRFSSVRAKLLLVVFVLGLSGFLYWAANSQIGQTVHAPGQVIVKARTQSIQAAIDGVVTAVLVGEGDRVVAGQVIVTFDQVQAMAAVDDARGKVAALQAALARLRSEVLGVPLVFGADVDAYPEYRENQRQLYAARKRALDEDLTAVDRSLALVRQQIEITRPLVDAGDVGRLELIALQQREAELIGSRANRKNKYFAESQTEMTKAEEDLTTAQQLLADRNETLARTRITSPVTGIVKRVYANTVGGRLRPGDVILEVVPTSGNMVFEGRLSPTDISYVRNGLEASVKLDPYDSSIYGSLRTRVVYVSPDAIIEKTSQGEITYYTVQVALRDADVEGWNRQKRGAQTIALQPGMTGTIDVHTGERSLMSYLTRPVNKTMDRALTER